MIGTTLGHFRVVEKIAAGGMGEVYRARDLHLGRDVAIKVLPPLSLSETSARRRFRKEADALAQLNHPNIQTVHDFDTQEGVDFLVVELVPGPTLAQRIGAGPLRESEVAVVGTQVARALEDAHEHGVVHRDLKPGNVKITPKGQVKVLDFGLARLLSMDRETALSERLTETTSVSGTLPYMAPEQLRNEDVDHRSDIWSLGVVLYEMATRRLPFEARLATALAADIQHEAVPHPSGVNPKISARLEKIILKCLEKNPEHRYQSAGEVAVDLSRLVAVPPQERMGAAKTRRPIWAYAMGGLLLLGLLLAALLNIGTLREERQTTGQADALRIQSLAVLPLKNMSGDAEQDYLAEGMHEALITEFSKISALKVISRTSTLRYKETDKPLRDVARELGDVDGIIEGSVFREGDAVRITVQLIHGPTDHHLWAESYQRELRSILALHAEVAQAVAEEIKVKVTPQEKVRLAATPTVNPRAYEFYVLGRHHFHERLIGGLAQATELFQKALALDPEHAPSLAALAETLMLRGMQGSIPQQDARTQAWAALRRALELDDTLAEVQTSLGQFKLEYEWNWAESEQAFLRAIELNPGYSTAYHLYGRLLGFAGRFSEAFPILQRATELDPLSVPVRSHLAQVHLYARDYEQAERHLHKALELDPTHSLAHHNLGELALARGLPAEAIPSLEKAAVASPSSHYVAMLGCGYAAAKRSTDSDRILQELERRSRDKLVSAFDMASMYAARGDSEAALSWLERGYQERDTWLIELKAWPWFDSLKDDPRYQAVLQAMNFPAVR